MSFIPGASRGIGEIHHAHARLPQVALPHGAIRLLDQIMLALRFLKQARMLRNVWIDPHTDVQAARLQAAQHALRIGKHGLVPGEIAPMPALHPEAIEMEHRKRNVPLLHAAEEMHYGGLIVIRGEGSGQPQAKRPGWRQSGPTREMGIARKRVFERIGPRTSDDVKAQGFALGGKAHALHVFTADLKGNVRRAIHKHAVSLAGKIEGHVFVC